MGRQDGRRNHVEPQPWLAVVRARGAPRLPPGRALPVRQRRRALGEPRHRRGAAAGLHRADRHLRVRRRGAVAPRDRRSGRDRTHRPRRRDRPRRHLEGAPEDRRRAGRDARERPPVHRRARPGSRARPRGAAGVHDGDAHLRREWPGTGEGPHPRARRRHDRRPARRRPRVRGEPRRVPAREHRRSALHRPRLRGLPHARPRRSRPERSARRSRHRSSQRSTRRRERPFPRGRWHDHRRGRRLHPDHPARHGVAVRAGVPRVELGVPVRQRLPGHPRRTRRRAEPGVLLARRPLRRRPRRRRPSR